MKQRDTARIVRWLVLVLLVAPVVVFLVLESFANSNGWQMRTEPVRWMWLIPSGLLLVLVSSWFSWWVRKRFQGGGRVKRGVRFTAVTLFWLAMCWNALLLILVATFLPSDKVVEYEGKSAVVQTGLFEGMSATYYEDKGPFFKGDEIASQNSESSEYLVPQMPPTSVPEVVNPEDSEAPRSEEEQAAEALAETEAAFEETGSIYRVTGTVTSQINSNTGSFSFRVDDGAGVLENGRTYQVQEIEDVRRLYGMKGLQWGMDGVVIGFAEIPPNSVLYAGVIIGNDDTSSAYWENS